jgi:hypothetical protein
VSVKLRPRRIVSGFSSREAGDVFLGSPIDDIQIDRHVRRAMSRCRITTNDDEFHIGTLQKSQQAREVGQTPSGLTRERRKVSANRAAASIFSIRSCVDSFRFSRISVTSTPFLYASITGSGARVTNLDWDLSCTSPSINPSRNLSAKARLLRSWRKFLQSDWRPAGNLVCFHELR